VSVAADVNCYVDLCRGTSHPRLELEDDWILVWEEVSVCDLVVNPGELTVAVGR